MWRRFALVALSCAVVPALSCKGGSNARPLLPRSQTWAELRVVRRAVTVHAPEESDFRAPHPRERIVDGEVIRVEDEGLAWLRRDGGATLLVRGPAELTVRSEAIEIAKGRVFIDTPSSLTTDLVTPGGPLHLAHVRASVDVGAATDVYVLAGEVRTEGAERAGAGEDLTITGSGAEARTKVVPIASWEDWTGGLATTDRAAEPAPFGVGTVGARRAGEQGSPRFPLAIQKLDVHVRIDRDFAITEVDEVFFNPSSDTVEGLYRFRTPDGAVLHRFGVDREGAVVWGRVKEKAAAAAQYQANVYQGSTEDPALLEWDAPGTYRARLYPIGPGETRRVVVSYAEWLGRTGAKRDRRLYVYPMAADGPEESLPHIEELSATIELGHAGAKEVRAGMAGVREGEDLLIRAHDFVPRADLAVELFDEGLPIWRGYEAGHVVDPETLPNSERAEAARRASGEAPYVLIPVTTGAAPTTMTKGLDLAIVIDTSAATETASLAIARAATRALLAHLGPDDRVVVWAGDATLRPVVPGHDKLAKLDEAGRRDVLAQLATVERGGATDLGAMLAAAAQSLDPDPNRRGAVVYIGDGAPTVGELSLVDLQARLAKLPHPVRIFGLGVGDGADMAILGGVAKGAFAERIGDGNAAARAALRLLEIAERPAFVGASMDLGPTVERIYPRELGAIVEGEPQVVIGRLIGAAPTSFTLHTASGTVSVPVKVSSIEDRGDLSRRWANGRLAQMIDEGVGRAAMVDLGTRHGIITPVTSLYVPTKNEMTAQERSELEAKKSAKQKGRPWRARNEEAEATTEADTGNADGKEGGMGTRAKGESGGHTFGSRMRAASRADTASAPAATAAPPAAAAAAPAAAPSTVNAPGGPARRITPDEAPASPTTASTEAARREAAEFGMIGLLNPQADQPQEQAPSGNAWGATIDRDDSAKNDVSKLDLPSGGGIGLGSIGTVGHGAGGGGRGVGDGPAAQDHRAFAKAAPDPAKPSSDPSSSLRNKTLYLHGNSKDAPPADKVAEVPVSKKQAEYRAPADATIVVRFGDLGHAAFRCSSAASLPFEERVALWRERLAAVGGNWNGAASVYRRALAACEAPTWRERSRLTSMMLDVMPSVQAKVMLWRVMFGDLGVADALYRGLLARMRTPAELRQLHDALGLRSIDPGVLAKMMKDAKSTAERVTKLRALVLEWPDDFALALKLLDMLEDDGDDNAARELARKLRARPDADARLRTAIGELYLRIASRAADPRQKALDEAEARRAFGEIVEFAPDDPIARRRLGDLLRAHGWYAEAARQYETLARLTPDDPSVDLLLASAAQGLGKLEEAVRWTEKGAQSGAPDADAGPARTARSFAVTWLAWGRNQALAEGRAEEAKALGARLARARSTDRLAGGTRSGTRVSLVWAHPELHPTLWTNALGAPMPAPETDVTLGIAAATLPAKDGAVVEVRLDPEELEHAARLGAQATLTCLFDEGGPDERIVVTKIDFRGARATRTFSVAGGAVTEVSR